MAIEHTLENLQDGEDYYSFLLKSLDNGCLLNENQWLYILNSKNHTNFEAYEKCFECCPQIIKNKNVNWTFHLLVGLCSNMNNLEFLDDSQLNDENFAYEIARASLLALTKFEKFYRNREFFEKFSNEKTDYFNKVINTFDENKDADFIIEQFLAKPYLIEEDEHIHNHFYEFFKNCPFTINKLMLEGKIEQNPCNNFTAMEQVYANMVKNSIISGSFFKAAKVDGFKSAKSICGLTYIPDMVGTKHFFAKDGTFLGSVATEYNLDEGQEPTILNNIAKFVFQEPKRILKLPFSIVQNQYFSQCLGECFIINGDKDNDFKNNLPLNEFYSKRAEVNDYIDERFNFEKNENKSCIFETKDKESEIE